MYFKHQTGESAIQIFRRLLFGVFFAEMGLVLVLVPWSTFWDRNYFIETIPLIQRITHNYFVRGTISGCGLINMFIGLVELYNLLRRCRLERPVPPALLPRIKFSSSSAAADVDESRTSRIGTS